MKKGYAVYLTVMSLLSLAGIVVVNRALDKAQANLDALSAEVSQVQSAISTSQVASSASAANAAPAEELEVTVEHPVPAPVVHPVQTVDLGGASPKAHLSGRVYRNADLPRSDTLPRAPADTSAPHLIIDVGRSGRLDLRAALSDNRLQCTQVSPGRLSCAQ